MSKPMRKTTIGGQALIEGLLMRGPDKLAAVIRKSDGEYEIKEESVKPEKEKNAFLRAPFIRGAVNFVEMMKVGISYLSYSAEVSGGEDYEPDKLDMWIEKKFGKEKAEKLVITVAMILGVGFSVLLFILLPTLLVGAFSKLTDSGILRNLIEGGLRICIFLAYLWLVSNMKDMQRLFAYHGAEHKTIFCYEAGAGLTVENVRGFKRQHPRCGTSFLFIVMIISILVFSFVSWSNPFIRMALRIALLPVVVGISYEISRAVGRHDNPFTRFLRAPGLLLQNLTTREPDDDMIEVAIEALTRVVPEDKNSDRW